MSKKLVSKSKNHSLEKEWKYREYIKMRSNAEKNGDESFVYKNITYVKTVQPIVMSRFYSDDNIYNPPDRVVIYVRQQQNYE